MITSVASRPRQTAWAVASWKHRRRAPLSFPLMPLALGVTVQVLGRVSRTGEPASGVKDRSVTAPSYEQLAVLVAAQERTIAQLQARIAEQDARIAELERRGAAPPRRPPHPPP